ncbi:MAG: hypothetical protein JWP82_899, partial [Humibacillus sp.]|nr:hypothetical protein [Humibacillus sp.]
RQVYPALATAYLKGETHYVIGAHGLQGLVRLLEARATAAPVAELAAHPDSALLAARPHPHLTVDPTDYDHVVFLTYSIHGSCIAVVLDLRDGAVGTRARATQEVAA